MDYDDSDGLIGSGGPVMPPDEAKFLEENISGARCYLEYGCGGSTLLAAKQNISHVISVESDGALASSIRKRSQENCKSSNVDIIYIDIGPVGLWGYPLDVSRRAYWPDYSTYVWRNMPRDRSPQFILIDGRFRVACLMATLLYAKPGGIVMFDDLKGRWHAYGALSAVVNPIQMVGRAGIFQVSSNINKPFARHILGKFAYDPR